MYKIQIIPSAIKDLDRLDKKFFDQIKKRILALSSNPRPVNSLKLTNEQGYRIRNGDYRILYRIDDTDKLVYIYRIKHRKDVYK
ncbi:MAG: type II toxin-antitoxin system RelE/ParE family toxin [Candidatus Omnitrophica bacterium]|nr:type II toxin-antitoxin system RelE/ParE family toxin [Candidatus Omnitrophota bacterium]MBU4590909.1 type II toxin-antitoxin system RelE/ParE family toxin [Candidatus Omnitrophota bacterium]